MIFETKIVPDLTQNFCTWILSGFCSVREDKRACLPAGRKQKPDRVQPTCFSSYLVFIWLVTDLHSGVPGLSHPFLERLYDFHGNLHLVGWDAGHFDAGALQQPERDILFLCW